jgi:hypothetical protein
MCLRTTDIFAKRSFIKRALFPWESSFSSFYAQFGHAISTFYDFQAQFVDISHEPAGISFEAYLLRGKAQYPHAPSLKPGEKADDKR